MEQRCSLGVCVSEGVHSPSLGIKKDGYKESFWTLYLAFTLSRTHRYPRERETGKGQQVSVESSRGRILTGKKLRLYDRLLWHGESLAQLWQGIPESGRWAAGV